MHARAPSVRTPCRAPIRSRRSAVLLFLLAAAVPSAAAAPKGDPRAFETLLAPPVSVEGEPAERWTLEQRMAHWKVPGVSIAVIRDGKVAWARGYGVLQAGRPEKVDTETVFSVGSVSKVGTAAAALRLVDAGKLALDRNVNDYLTRWKVPDNPYTAVRPVTLRGLMSHSAGLTVHGFGDFQPGEKLPTVIDTLEGRPPAKHEPVRVTLVPGTQFRYSGGGTTVEQLLIEETTGLDFPAATRQLVFEPLGMRRSTYENPLPPEHGNIAKAHGEDGSPQALPRGYEAMPEMGASGLWTTPSDYARLVIAFIDSYRGRPGSFLSAPLARQLLSEVGRSQVGLGPFLDGEGMDRRFSHGGANDSYRAWMEGHPGTGNGLVIFTNGTNGGELAGEIRAAIALAEGWSPGLSKSQRRRVPPLALSPQELEEKAGVYEVQEPLRTLEFRNRGSGVAYQVVHRDGRLYLRQGADRNVRLIPIDASRFLREDDDTHAYEFVRGYDGTVGRLIVHGDSADFTEAVKVGAAAR